MVKKLIRNTTYKFYAVCMTQSDKNAQIRGLYSLIKIFIKKKYFMILYPPDKSPDDIFETDLNVKALTFCRII